jgi:riboflavin synthase
MKSFSYHIADERMVRAMFTGIVQKVGIVKSLQRRAQSAELKLEIGEFAEDVKVGDSVMVDGVCLTVTELNELLVCFDVGTETLAKTTLGGLRKNDPVNIELAMRPDDRFGGHFVSGHIDGTGTISVIESRPGETRLFIRVPSELRELMIPKGSVAVDGVSLTIAELGPAFFEVSLIPHTLASTTLNAKHSGDRVNIECDMIGKWVRNFASSKDNNKKAGLSLEELKEKGF